MSHEKLKFTVSLLLLFSIVLVFSPNVLLPGIAQTRTTSAPIPSPTTSPCPPGMVPTYGPFGPIGCVPLLTVTFLTDPSNVGSITVLSVGTFVNGQSATLDAGTYAVSANPPIGYLLSQWTTSQGVQVSSPFAQSTTLTVSGNGLLKAWFKASGTCPVGAVCSSTANMSRYTCPNGTAQSACTTDTVFTTTTNTLLPGLGVLSGLGPHTIYIQHPWWGFAGRALRGRGPLGPTPLLITIILPAGFVIFIFWRRRGSRHQEPHPNLT